MKWLTFHHFNTQSGSIVWLSSPSRRTGIKGWSPSRYLFSSLVRSDCWSWLKSWYTDGTLMLEVDAEGLFEHWKSSSECSVLRDSYALVNVPRVSTVIWSWGPNVFVKKRCRKSGFKMVANLRLSHLSASVKYFSNQTTIYVIIGDSGSSWSNTDCRFLGESKSMEYSGKTINPFALSSSKCLVNTRKGCKVFQFKYAFCTKNLK